MIDNVELWGAITLALLPYVLIISIIMVAIWMLIKRIPIWIKQWKDLDNDWWE